ncbi:MAG: pitrilysin family protein [Candidatus Sericytochromatia bacterium]|nr:pitrilysin family protein [Candidatus Sericytochromatia bacterium]
MQTRAFETLQERIFEETLPNGLTVQLVPKPGYAKTYAVFTTRYGSIDNHFQLADGPEHRVTDGIAHFLEHKLFEEEWGDIFHTFSTQGASANAFTSHTRTAYLFSATDEIETNLETLLDFVQRPHLTPENVEKEKGIIEQEIRMYDDMPFWRAYRHLLENLFVESPVRIDIAGTVESIGRIDREALMTCYETFYHPSNMRLCVVGDFDAETMMQRIRDNQARKAYAPPRPIVRHRVAEPATVARQQHRVKLAVSRPLVVLGWKDKQAIPEAEHLHRELLMGLIQDVVFGRSSVLFQDLLDRGLIDDALSYDYEVGDGYGFSYLGAETDDPQALTEAVQAALEAFVRDGIPEDEFVRAGHKQIGDYLYTLNSPEAIANQVTEAAFQNADYFAVPDMLAAMTREQANVLLQEHFDPAQCVSSVVLPQDEDAAVPA